MGKKDKPTTYRIEILGQLDESWSDWFNGLTVQVGSGGTTTLTGSIADQSALRGILSRVWSLNLVVLSVNRFPAENTGRQAGKGRLRCQTKLS